MIFSIFRFFLLPQIPDFQIVVSRPNIVITNHTSMESYLFSFRMIYKSRFQKTVPYDWFCGSGSQFFPIHWKSMAAVNCSVCAQQKWETQTGLGQLEGEFILI